MPRDPVRISTDLRRFVLDAVVEKLQSDGIEVITASLDSNHLHVLARFRDHNPRHWIGWAKYHATKRLKAHAQSVGFDLRLKLGEGLWAKRSRAEPITGRAHQLNTHRYILNHARREAAVWAFTKDGADLAGSKRGWGQIGHF